jgi:hypothetical protein
MAIFCYIYNKPFTLFPLHEESMLTLNDDMRLLCPFMVEQGYFLMFKWHRIIAVLIFALTFTSSSRPTQAAGIVTNCTFADLTTALAGGVVDFNIGADCTFSFTNTVYTMLIR